MQYVIDYYNHIETQHITEGSKMDNDFYSNAAKGMKAGQIKIMTSILLLVARIDGVWLETVHGEKLEWITESNQA